MENKILVKLYVPMLEKKYDVFLPVTKRICEITVLIGKALMDISNGTYEISGTERMYSRFNGKEYDSKQLLKGTDIRNGTQIIFL